MGTPSTFYNPHATSCADKEEVMLALDQMHKRMIEAQMFRSCLNCIQFDTKTEQCLMFKVRPPAEVILYSCGPTWEADVPF